MPKWQGDQLLCSDLKQYVAANYHRKEILGLLQKSYPQYSVSIPTLDRMLRHFDIRYIDYQTSEQQIRSAIQNELSGPGKLLGYRALNQKLRTEHGIKVPRDVVALIQRDIDPEGVANRRIGQKPKKEKIPFESLGPNWLWSLDGHDKMMGFQASTFPLAIYGCQDTFSRKIIFLKVWTSNSDPLLIASFFMEHISETGVIPKYLRLDKGTETGLMASIHAYLRRFDDDVVDPSDCIQYGSSTANKIESWWKHLHERMEKDIKKILLDLKNNGNYDPEKEEDRNLLAYLCVPVLQRECNLFVSVWNSHRIRKQKNIALPYGIPDHIFNCPEQYGCSDQGVSVTEEQLINACEESCVDDAATSYLSEEQINIFQPHFPNPELLECNDIIDAYIGLKALI